MLNVHNSMYTFKNILHECIQPNEMIPNANHEVLRIYSKEVLKVNCSNVMWCIFLATMLCVVFCIYIFSIFMCREYIVWKGVWKGFFLFYCYAKLRFRNSVVLYVMIL